MFQATMPIISRTTQNEIKLKFLEISGIFIFEKISEIIMTDVIPILISGPVKTS